MWEAGGKWALQISQELADPRGPSHVFLKSHYSCMLVVSPTQTSTCSQFLISSCYGSSVEDRIPILKYQKGYCKKKKKAIV